MEATKAQVDGIWGFCHAKVKNLTDAGPDEYGDAWTWTAIDRETKLIYSHVVGDRTLDTTLEFEDVLEETMIANCAPAGLTTTSTPHPKVVQY